MKKKNDSQTLVMVSYALAVLMSLQAFLGRLFPGQYKDAAWIKATWIGNDWITLFVAVPILVVALSRGRRSHLRERILWLAIIGYAFYNYAYYLFGAALNIFFPIYVVCLLLAVFSLIHWISLCKLNQNPETFFSNFPVHIISGYLIFIGAGLALVWLVMWGAYIFFDVPTPVETSAFQVVAAIDLSIIAPLLLTAGIQLSKKKVLGAILAASAGTLGALYLLILSVNSFIQIRLGFASMPGELPIWVPLCLFTTAAALFTLFRFPWHIVEIEPET